MYKGTHHPKVLVSLLLVAESHFAHRVGLLFEEIVHNKAVISAYIDVLPTRFNADNLETTKNMCMAIHVFQI